MKLSYFTLLFFIVLAGFFACQSNEPVLPETLPENELAVDNQSGLTAQYVYPTSRYDHGILGDQIEAAGLWVSHNGKNYEFQLPENQIFEDIKPRLYDFNGDNIPEIITILTHIELGASVAVFKLYRKSLRLEAQSVYIGQTHRWLNIAAIDDLDSDGSAEIAWVSTPHIGGILKIAHMIGKQISVLDSIDGVTNHKIRSANQDLTVVASVENSKILYLPNMSFSKIIGIGWNGNEILAFDTIQQVVDYAVPLYLQFTGNK